jgi:hypothetical protein
MVLEDIRRICRINDCDRYLPRLAAHQILSTAAETTGEYWTAVGTGATINGATSTAAAIKRATTTAAAINGSTGPSVSFTRSFLGLSLRGAQGLNLTWLRSDDLLLG